MSSDFRRFFTPDTIAMLERVLAHAGLRDCIDPMAQQQRLVATRSLIARFQRGMTDEADLGSSLVDDGDDQALPVAVPVSAKTFSDRSNHIASITGNGSRYRFGTRVALDGRWAIYDVLTGIPARFGVWKMVDLNVKTADRALKILNSPATAV